jgi:hypothetical protein
MEIPLIGGQLSHIVGEPIEIFGHTTDVCVTVRCKCHPDNPPNTLRQTQPICCGACGNIYRIVQIKYDIRREGDGLPLIAVAVVGRADVPEQPKPVIN